MTPWDSKLRNISILNIKLSLYIIQPLISRFSYSFFYLKVLNCFFFIAKQCFIDNKKWLADVVLAVAELELTAWDTQRL